MADMIHHTDGQDYFIFDEDLYGYSVLRLSDLASVHYIPAESCGNYTGKFEETFIWFNCYYNPENNMLAVNVCIWSAPSSVIVMDFSDPMRIVEAKEWSDVYISCMDDYYDLDDIDFVRWQGSKLICKAKGAKPAAFVLDGKVEVDFE